MEASEAVTFAKMLVAHNDMSSKIEVMSGKIEDVSLPEEVDVILAEWMGTLLLVRFNWDLFCCCV